MKKRLTFNTVAGYYRSPRWGGKTTRPYHAPARNLRSVRVTPGIALRSLAICRSIVDAHGGRLTAKGLEDGAEFTCALPVYRE